MIAILVIRKEFYFPSENKLTTENKWNCFAFFSNNMAKVVPKFQLFLEEVHDTEQETGDSPGIFYNGKQPGIMHVSTQQN